MANQTIQFKVKNSCPLHGLNQFFPDGIPVKTLDTEPFAPTLSMGSRLCYEIDTTGVDKTALTKLYLRSHIHTTARKYLALYAFQEVFAIPQRWAVFGIVAQQENPFPSILLTLPQQRVLEQLQESYKRAIVASHRAEVA